MLNVKIELMLRKNVMKKILFLTFIMISLNLFAGYKDIPVTRDLDLNAEYDTYQDWLEDHPQQQTHSS